MIYLVIRKVKSNHTKVVAAFKSRHLAEVYRLHKQNERGSEYNLHLGLAGIDLEFFVQEVSILDGTPEINKIMLGGSRN